MQARTYIVHPLTALGGADPLWVLELEALQIMTFRAPGEALSVGARLAQADWLQRELPAQVRLDRSGEPSEVFVEFGADPH